MYGLYGIIGIIAIVIVTILFKCITNGFLIGGELSRRKGEKANKAATKQAENDIINQMNKFNASTNYYAEKHKQLQEQALQEAQFQQMQDDSIVETLKNALIYFEYSFPLADKELLKKYSQAFFMQKVDLLKTLEKQIEESHNKQLQQEKI